MSIFLSECIGCFFLLLFGSGTVANVVTDKSKGQNSGWIVISIGWALAVFIGVYASRWSGSHINPAITIALAYKGDIAWSLLPQYIGGQLLGCFLGSTIAWLTYRDHIDQTNDAGSKLAVFSTSPAINRPVQNFITEMVGTFTLMAAILFLPEATTDLGQLNAFPVALIVLAIGIGLGGPTGYAINPARDLGPRIAHFLLPIKGKGNSNWSYSWVPILGPIAGAILAVILKSWMM